MIYFNEFESSVFDFFVHSETLVVIVSDNYV